MTQRRSYPRGHLERTGIVSARVTPVFNPSHFTKDEPGDREADHHVLVTKRKGFGTTGNRESTCMSIHGVNLLLKSFTPDKFMRYKVNVYLKEKRT